MEDGIWRIWSPSSSHSPQWPHISHNANVVWGNVAPSLSFRGALFDKLLMYFSFGNKSEAISGWEIEKDLSHSICRYRKRMKTHFLNQLLTLSDGFLHEHTIICKCEEDTGYFIHAFHFICVFYLCCPDWFEDVALLVKWRLFPWTNQNINKINNRRIRSRVASHACNFYMWNYMW